MEIRNEDYITSIVTDGEVSTSKLWLTETLVVSIALKQLGCKCLMRGSWKHAAKFQDTELVNMQCVQIAHKVKLWHPITTHKEVAEHLLPVYSISGNTNCF